MCNCFTANSYILALKKNIGQLQHLLPCTTWVHTLHFFVSFHDFNACLARGSDNTGAPIHWVAVQCGAVIVSRKCEQNLEINNCRLLIAGTL